MNLRTLISVGSLVLIIWATSRVSADECAKWFERGKIKTGQDCTIECSVLSVDMGTFDCPSRCPEFCKAPVKENMLFALSDLYPGLTPAEKALASKYPAKLLQAYQLTWQAEKICLGKYRRMETNNESDACRHFVWAALMAKEFDSKFAQQVLDAHEQEPTQPTEEKAMDLANNQRGVSLIKDAGKENKFSDGDLLKEFEGQLKEGKIVVLTPQNPKGTP